MRLPVLRSVRGSQIPSGRHCDENVLQSVVGDSAAYDPTPGAQLSGSTWLSVL